ncbi:MAG: SDR family oxidoreductase [Chlamydiales bacterium]|nr:SDR family oxidoreductase [Chlamydiia bacterium]MCP5507541.1 SDR family oxidoreductase [Chlamydiales bacterium]
MKILLTGANGYIGSRLLPVLVEKGHHVVACVRSEMRFRVPEFVRDQVTVIEADFLKPETLNNIPDDIDAAYYLLHSMAQSKEGFEDLEQRCARHFVEAMKKTTVKQIIYLSGLIPEGKLSKHLRSRFDVEKIIADSGIAYTVLRAGIIIGSGSASFEIIRDLVEKLPVMVAPRWVTNRCQPIAIYDILQYLAGVIGNDACLNEIFDVGGPEKLTYEEMLYTYAEERGLRRYIINVPVLTPRLSSYWLYFVTSTNFSLARSLVESLRNEAVCRDDRISKSVPIRCMTYREALRKTFDKVNQNAVVSSWKDALSQGMLQSPISDFIEVPTHGCLTDVKAVSFDCDREQVIEKIWSIGGDHGWYFMDWAWTLRGFIDKVVGGVGVRRGRRDPRVLAAGDVLDFWRVIVADRPAGHLLLYAEMRLPGEAWLEFRVEEKRMVQKATFRPRGLLGRLYWYGLLPFHHLIFAGMARALVTAK